MLHFLAQSLVAASAVSPPVLHEAPVLSEPLEASVSQDPPKIDFTGSFPGSFRIPGSELSFKLGGRIKVDGIHDFGSIGDTDAFKTSSIPVPDVSSDGNTSFHARDTRLHLEARVPSDVGEIRGYVEGNFFGTGDSFTLRHAYVEAGGILAGQTWTNFMMIDSRPETLDFEGPDGSVFLRQTQFRWTQPISETAHWSIALEDASSDVTSPVGTSAEQVYPDLSTGIRVDNERGHTYLSGIARDIAYKGPMDDSVFGWGASMSGRVNTVGKDNFRYQVAYGHGIARYIEDLRGLGLDAALDAGGDLEALPTYGGFISYQHHWNEKLRSNAVYSMTGVDNTSGQMATALKQTSFVSANLICALAKRFDVGVEFLHGMRENKDGESADVDRLQFSVIYSF